jgi:ATP-dependent Clp protease protease subunit
MAKKNVKAEKKTETAKPEMKAPGTYLRENGVLWLNDKFDKDNIYPLVVAIQEFNLMPKEIAPKQIKLIINSPGGAVHWAFPLINAIKMSEIPVITIVDGLAASCGCLLAMSGDKRIAMANASIMSHQYSWGSTGKEHELYGKIKEFEMSSARMIEHYKKCTKKNEKYIRKHLLCATDVWLSPEEAVKHGIIDEIWESY